MSGPMKTPPLAAAVLALLALATAARAQDAAETTEKPTPADPFGDVKSAPEAKPYSVDVDRTRGVITVKAEDGTYQEGSHFAHWMWRLNAPRWGRYFVRLRYTSTSAKIGVQVKIGEQVVKSYAPRSGGHAAHQEYGLILGHVYLDKAGEYPVVLLTGDKSKGPTFFVKAIDLLPAPESEEVAQGIDGTIELHAKSATTFSQILRFEPKAEKNCLGYWTDQNDWAEWEFGVSTPGKFRIAVVQGCGDGNGGSEVALMVNENTFKFQVEETGGFQNWKSRELGIVEIPHAGEHRIALKPLTKTGKAVMDVQKVVLIPISG